MEQALGAYKTIYQGGVGEIEIKKSRFIATVSHTESEDEALSFIMDLKKKYWDATHNCYAYIIGTNNPVMRCSDDGEPSQTAGKPMLDVLINKELTNLVVVVTRYFGGTLLGTGGLVKAYQSATIEGLNNSIIITKEPGIRMEVISDYNLIGKIQYYLGQENFHLISSEYTDTVKLDVMVPLNKTESFKKKITDLSNGTIKAKEIKQAYFAIIDGKVHLF